MALRQTLQKRLLTDIENLPFVNYEPKIRKERILATYKYLGLNIPEGIL